jgi:hypothetical protein
MIILHVPSPVIFRPARWDSHLAPIRSSPFLWKLSSSYSDTCHGAARHGAGGQPQGAAAMRGAATTVVVVRAGRRSELRAPSPEPRRGHRRCFIRSHEQIWYGKARSWRVGPSSDVGWVLWRDLEQIWPQECHNVASWHGGARSWRVGREWHVVHPWLWFRSSGFCRSGNPERGVHRLEPLQVAPQRGAQHLCGVFWSGIAGQGRSLGGCWAAAEQRTSTSPRRGIPRSLHSCRAHLNGMSSTRKVA